MNFKSITAALFLACAITLVSWAHPRCPEASAQDQGSTNPPMRLSRTGMRQSLTAVSKPFALGVEQKSLPIPEIEVPSRSHDADVPAFSVRLLTNYDLELIVDQSMSMLTMDCPDLTSRWSWCGAQAHDLASKLAPFTPKGLTITTFAKHYVVHPDARAADIEQLFSGPALGQGTRLAEPLSDRLNSYFARRGPGSKPLLIAVITDGVPEPEIEATMVENTIISATGALKDPHEVTIVFFQIGGGDYKGRFFLHELDTDLVNYGARFDIVRVVSFDRLEQIGLAQALVESIQDFARERK